MPAIQRDAIIPPRPKARQPTILRLELEGCNLLKGVLFGVPLDADVVDGLFGEVAQELGAEGVGHAVRGVEGAEGLGDGVDWCVVWDCVLRGGEGGFSGVSVCCDEDWGGRESRRTFSMAFCASPSGKTPNLAT